jgi:hypothetical protein
MLDLRQQLLTDGSYHAFVRGFEIAAGAHVILDQAADMVQEIIDETVIGHPAAYQVAADAIQVIVNGCINHLRQGWVSARMSEYLQNQRTHPLSAPSTTFLFR